MDFQYSYSNVKKPLIKTRGLANDYLKLIH